MRVLPSSTRRGSSSGTRWTTWASKPRTRCDRGREVERRLQAFLLFLDFLLRSLLLVLAALLPAASDWPPLARLDLPARVHAANEERDHADHAAPDRVRLPGGLPNVHRRRGPVLVRDPCVRLRRIEDVHLEGLVPLTEQAGDVEHELDAVAGVDRMVRPHRLTGL